MASLARFQPVPVHPPGDRTLPQPGSCWSLDPSATFLPDIWGYTAYILFADVATWYLCVYLVRDLKSDFWPAVQRHVDWCRSKSKQMGSDIL